MNFNGALFVEENIVGLGVIIRNDSGLVMDAFSQQIPLSASIEIIEVLAIR